jgi:hypothetical protein
MTQKITSVFTETLNNFNINGAVDHNSLNKQLLEFDVAPQNGSYGLQGQKTVFSSNDIQSP